MSASSGSRGCHDGVSDWKRGELARLAVAKFGDVGAIGLHAKHHRAVTRHRGTVAVAREGGEPRRASGCAIQLPQIDEAGVVRGGEVDARAVGRERDGADGLHVRHRHQGLGFARRRDAGAAVHADQAGDLSRGHPGRRRWARALGRTFGSRAIDGDAPQLRTVRARGSRRQPCAVGAGDGLTEVVQAWRRGRGRSGCHSGRPQWLARRGLRVVDPPTRRRCRVLDEHAVIVQPRQPPHLTVRRRQRNARPAGHRHHAHEPALAVGDEPAVGGELAHRVAIADHAQLIGGGHERQRRRRVSSRTMGVPTRTAPLMRDRR